MPFVWMGHMQWEDLSLRNNDDCPLGHGSSWPGTEESVYTLWHRRVIAEPMWVLCHIDPHRSSSFMPSFYGILKARSSNIGCASEKQERILVTLSFQWDFGAHETFGWVIKDCFVGSWCSVLLKPSLLGDVHVSNPSSLHLHSSFSSATLEFPIPQAPSVTLLWLSSP